MPSPSPPDTGAQALDRLERWADVLRRGLQCDAASVGWWDRDADVLRILVNVGELAPGEVRRPETEAYSLEHFPALHGLLTRGEPYSFAPGDHPDAASATLAAELGRDTQAAVPILVDGEVWGEFWVARTTRPGGPAGRVDVELLGWLAPALALWPAAEEPEARYAGATRYEIRVGGRMSPAACAEFHPLAARREDGQTVLTGPVEDQAQLYGHLNRILRHRLELVSVQPLED